MVDYTKLTNKELRLQAINNSYAAFELGMRHFTGSHNLSQDNKMALKWLQYASEKGCLAASDKVFFIRHQELSELSEQDEMEISISEQDEMEISISDQYLPDIQDLNDEYSKQFNSETESPITTKKQAVMVNTDMINLIVEAMKVSISNVSSFPVNGKNEKTQALIDLKDSFVKQCKQSSGQQNINVMEIEALVNEFYNVAAKPRNTLFGLFKAEHGKTKSATAFMRFIKQHPSKEFKDFMAKNIFKPKEGNGSQYDSPTC